MVEDIGRALMEGLRLVPSVGAVITGQAARLPFLLVDSVGGEVEPVSACLRDLMLGDASPLTCRSYAFDLLRWHVTAATTPLRGSLRRQTLTALRSLFGHCKKTGRIFADPTRGIDTGQRPLKLIQPLQPAEIDQATAAALTPAARLALALAAVHAARPKTIRELHLGDIDLGNRRMALTGWTRPLDDLTRRLLLAWLDYRARRWPGTANPHLIINQQAAMTTRAVSENWLTETCRGLTATLERLRVDRQLEEALTHGPDPLHLAAVFGLDDTTAIRYATIARQLLQTPTEQTPTGPREPKDQNGP